MGVAEVTPVFVAAGQILPVQRPSGVAGGGGAVALTEEVVPALAG